MTNLNGATMKVLFSDVLNRKIPQDIEANLKCARRQYDEMDFRADGGYGLEGESKEYNIDINIEAVDYDYIDPPFNPDEDEVDYFNPEDWCVESLFVVYMTLENKSTEEKFNSKCLASTTIFGVLKSLNAAYKHLMAVDPSAINSLFSLKDTRWHTYGYCT